MEKKKRKFKWWMIFPIIFGFMILIGLTALLTQLPLLNQIRDLTLQDINYDQLTDGVYTGSYVGETNQLRDITVQVTIIDGEISDIVVIEHNVNMDELSDDIDSLFDRIIAQESFDVDYMSGASITSITLMKALEQALLQAEA